MNMVYYIHHTEHDKLLLCDKFLDDRQIFFFYSFDLIVDIVVSAPYKIENTRTYTMRHTQ